jgi:hypothetical protein
MRIVGGNICAYLKWRRCRWHRSPRRDSCIEGTAEANADVDVRLEARAVGMDGWVPRVEVGQRNPSFLGDIKAAVPRFNQVEPPASRDHPRLVGLAVGARANTYGLGVRHSPGLESVLRY